MHKLVQTKLRQPKRNSEITKKKVCKAHDLLLSILPYFKHYNFNIILFKFTLLIVTGSKPNMISPLSWAMLWRNYIKKYSSYQSLGDYKNLFKTGMLMDYFYDYTYLKPWSPIVNFRKWIFTTAWEANQNIRPVNNTHPFLYHNNCKKEILFVKRNVHFIIVDKIFAASVVVKLQL